jgi:hypothetical protein
LARLRAAWGLGRAGVPGLELTQMRAPILPRAVRPVPRRFESPFPPCLADNRACAGRATAWPGSGHGFLSDCRMCCEVRGKVRRRS